MRYVELHYACHSTISVFFTVFKSLFVYRSLSLLSSCISNLVHTRIRPNIYIWTPRLRSHPAQTPSASLLLSPPGFLYMVVKNLEKGETICTKLAFLVSVKMGILMPGLWSGQLFVVRTSLYDVRKEARKNWLCSRRQYYFLAILGGITCLIGSKNSGGWPYKMTHVC